MLTTARKRTVNFFSSLSSDSASRSSAERFMITIHVHWNQSPSKRLSNHLLLLTLIVSGLHHSEADRSVKDFSFECEHLLVTVAERLRSETRKLTRLGFKLLRGKELNILLQYNNSEFIFCNNYILFLCYEFLLPLQLSQPELQPSICPYSTVEILKSLRYIHTYKNCGICFTIPLWSVPADSKCLIESHTAAYQPSIWWVFAGKS